MRTLIIVALLTSACARSPWMDVLDGMKRGTVVSELSTEDHDFNETAPEGFEVSPTNTWVLFVYDPEAEPKTHASFQKLTDTCYIAMIPAEDPEDPEDSPRNAALCPKERTPKPPPDLQL